MEISNETKSITITGSIIHIDQNKLLLLMTESDSELFDQGGLIINTLHDTYRTSSHQISNYETNHGLNVDQWLIEFTLDNSNVELDVALSSELLTNKARYVFEQAISFLISSNKRGIADQLELFLIHETALHDSSNADRAILRESLSNNVVRSCFYSIQNRT